MLAPPDHPPAKVGRVWLGAEPDGSGGVSDGVGQVRHIQAGRRGEHVDRIIGVGAVEAEDGVEVDRAPGPRFGDSRRVTRTEGGPARLTSRERYRPTPIAAPPRFRGEQVEHDLPGIVVTVETERATEGARALAVNVGAA